MKTDHVVRLEAMDALIATLGMVDAERFISMVKRDTFDYTEWQRERWNDKSIEEIHALATEYEKNNKPASKTHG
ncbi:MAG: hypothetical protein FWC50_11705 [Planctomycetaceae bacterium]|nr:hypothetical protein [Planctomycetaceae bacterium]